VKNWASNFAILNYPVLLMHAYLLGMLVEV